MPFVLDLEKQRVLVNPRNEELRGDLSEGGDGALAMGEN